MELKVWVDGSERSVSGVSVETTCAQLIHALAQATGQKGKFVLVECYHGRERSLSPPDRPVEMLRMRNRPEAEVSFLLRRISDEDFENVNCDESTYSAATHERTNLGWRNYSTSSMNPFDSSYQSRDQTIPTRNQTSTSSLPAYSDASLQRRRPPPDYNSTMERKMVGLARTSEASRNGRVAQDEIHMSQTDLLKLIQKQDAILDKQRSQLKIADLNLHSELEREIIQWETQKKNLEFVLESWRHEDFGRQYEEETLRHRQLRAKVLSMHEKLDLINESRKMFAEQEANLRQKIHDLSNEENGTAFPFP